MGVHAEEAVQTPVGHAEPGVAPAQVKPGQQVSEVSQRPPPRLQEMSREGAERHTPSAQTFSPEQQSALDAQLPPL
ncbi:hypothetical protein [Pyxidicoccus sp. MSG2]|uniref:hypothetical protein n=1 Tax=Pyxidicoccus sp. MSG2 TaxID=2996790 RepID=UPI00227063A8|nr:hypothetical protein [Pyxidicoccus sp. MSG2]MCY1023966.1 hypothetical protein [Pyxidicoccus sp. MSG2]